jgi:3-dehydroquinate dehydratase
VWRSSVFASWRWVASLWVRPIISGSGGWAHGSVLALAEIEAQCRALAQELGLECIFQQTNHEGEMVDWLQEAFEKQAAVIINPAGFSFRSVPVLDALKLIESR